MLINSCLAGTKKSGAISRHFILDVTLDADPRGGIKVDKYMQTENPDIFAAGNCAGKFSCITGKPSAIRLAAENAAVKLG